jgi:NAD(P)-dependent dehydrogenase (short-subunit alcohol dehydrogenase family)
MPIRPTVSEVSGDTPKTVRLSLQSDAVIRSVTVTYTFRRGEAMMSNGSNDSGSLAGKVAAVTGATSGSGRAIARRFTEEGAHVYLLARGADRLKDVQRLLGPSAVGIPMDVGDPESVREAFSEIENRHNKLDILINNAAIYRPVPFEALSDEEIAIHFRTNLLGPIYTCRAAIPLMRAAGGGDIVNTSSEATIESFAMLSMYAITKAGLEALGQALRTEYEKAEIRVTTLIQGVAAGEGGGSTGWEWHPDHSQVAYQRWEEDGILRRISGNHGSQQVDQVADVHLFVVTRPRGQKLDVLRVRSY